MPQNPIPSQGGLLGLLHSYEVLSEALQQNVNSLNDAIDRLRNHSEYMARQGREVEPAEQRGQVRDGETRNQQMAIPQIGTIIVEISEATANTPLLGLSEQSFDQPLLSRLSLDDRPALGLSPSLPIGSVSNTEDGSQNIDPTVEHSARSIEARIARLTEAARRLRERAGQVDDFTRSGRVLDIPFPSGEITNGPNNLAQNGTVDRHVGFEERIQRMVSAFRGETLSVSHSDSSSNQDHHHQPDVQDRSRERSQIRQDQGARRILQNHVPARLHTGTAALSRQMQAESQPQTHQCPSMRARTGASSVVPPRTSQMGRRRGCLPTNATIQQTQVPPRQVRSNINSPVFNSPASTIRPSLPTPTSPLSSALANDDMIPLDRSMTVPHERHEEISQSSLAESSSESNSRAFVVDENVNDGRNALTFRGMRIADQMQRARLDNNPAEPNTNDGSYSDESGLEWESAGQRGYIMSLLQDSPLSRFLHPPWAVPGTHLQLTLSGSSNDSPAENQASPQLPPPQVLPQQQATTSAPTIGSILPLGAQAIIVEARNSAGGSHTRILGDLEPQSGTLSQNDNAEVIRVTNDTRNTLMRVGQSRRNINMVRQRSLPSQANPSQTQTPSTPAMNPVIPNIPELLLTLFNQDVPVFEPGLTPSQSISLAGFRDGQRVDPIRHIALEFPGNIVDDPELGTPMSAEDRQSYNELLNIMMQRAREDTPREDNQTNNSVDETQTEEDRVITREGTGTATKENLDANIHLLSSSAWS
ncbi:hypothetical protein L204_103382 [Cryptococcus depauperatus]|nr:hypothetical protein L204_01700 [Cryptococcus depauperatus CBS 7855]